VAVAEDFTIGDLIRFVKKDETLQNFLACYSWCHHIENLNAQVDSPAAPDQKLWFAELYQKFKAAPRDDYWFNLEPALHAVGEVNESFLNALSEEERREWIDDPTHRSHHYGLGWSQVPAIAHLPVHCKTEADFFLLDKKNRIVKSEKVETIYTLLDVLDGFYWEISFYGNPDEVDSLRNELDRRMEEALEEMEGEDALS
jgi:hypothetical protein